MPAGTMSSQVQYAQNQKINSQIERDSQTNTIVNWVLAIMVIVVMVGGIAWGAKNVITWGINKISTPMPDMTSLPPVGADGFPAIDSQYSTSQPDAPPTVALRYPDAPTVSIGGGDAPAESLPVEKSPEGLPQTGPIPSATMVPGMSTRINTGARQSGEVVYNPSYGTVNGYVVLGAQLGNPALVRYGDEVCAYSYDGANDLMNKINALNYDGCGGYDTDLTLTLVYMEDGSYTFVMPGGSGYYCVSGILTVENVMRAAWPQEGSLEICENFRPHY